MSLNVDELVADALRTVVPDADVEGLDPDEAVRDALEMDSLDFLSFVEALSAGAGVRIEEDDYPRLQTLAGCRRFLETATTSAG
jgi:acyl carrier protein